MIYIYCKTHRFNVLDLPTRLFDDIATDVTFRTGLFGTFAEPCFKLYNTQHVLNVGMGKFNNYAAFYPTAMNGGGRVRRKMSVCQTCEL